MVKKLLFICLFFTAYSLAQEVKIIASTDSTHYLIGDQIKVRFQIYHGQTTRIEMPDLQDSLKPFEVLAADSIKVYAQPDGRVKEAFGLTIAAYDSVGSFSKSFTLLYAIAGDTAVHTAVSNSILISVARIKVDTLAEIKDVKGPLSEPEPPWWMRYWWVLVIIAILLMIASATFIIYMYRKLRPEKVIPEAILTDEQRAVKKLKELEEKQLWQKSQIKEYHSEITEIIREYFEKRYKIIALKLTTTETVEALRQQTAPDAVVVLTAEFLTLADMVKFAKHVPPFETNERMLEIAYLIVEKSTPAMVKEEEKA